MATATKKASPKSAKPIEGIFEDSPGGWYRYWTSEFRAAREEGSEDWTGITRFQETGNKIVRRYRASKKGSNRRNDSRINLFPANVQTLRAILVGQVPKCDVSRRYEDAEDDDARVAAQMLERVLNYGSEQESSGFPAVISRCTEDRLLPGMCGGRVQFSADFVPVPEQPAIMGPCPCLQRTSVAMPPELGMPPASPGPDPLCPQCQGSGQIEQAPAVPAHEKPSNEQADAVYVNWRDQLWGAARTFEEVRWWAFAADMSRKELKATFGDVDGAAIPMTAPSGKSKETKEAKKETPWSRARVWEIWSKEHGRVFHLVEGFPKTLQHVDNPTGEDPLGLDGFWPFPVPMMANATTDAYLPTPDYEYAKDLYEEADELTSRIRGIVRAIKVAGAYDKANGALKRLLDEAVELELIPVANFSEFLTKGGLAGAFQLLPIQEMVNTLQTLVAQRNIVIEGIYQITGLSDILRGQQQQAETATTSAIKARYASVRLQDLQKDVARYATDFQRLRKEIIAKHWSIETIIQRSSIMQSADGKDPERVLRAAKLIKDKHLDFRVVIRPEQISLQDWAQLKQQRSEVLQAIGVYFQSMMPFIQMTAQFGGPAGAKAAMKMVVGNAQWLIAGMPGANGVEAAFDSFVAEAEKIAEAAAKQPPQPPPPDPKVQQQQIKNQGEIQKRQADTQGRLVEIAAEAKADMATRQHDAQMDVLTDAAKTEARMRSDAVKQVAAVIPQGGGMA